MFASMLWLLLSVVDYDNGNVDDDLKCLQIDAATPIGYIIFGLLILKSV